MERKFQTLRRPIDSSTKRMDEIDFDTYLLEFKR